MDGGRREYWNMECLLPKKLFRYYRRHDLVKDLKMIEFSIKENPEVREIVYCSFQ